MSERFAEAATSKAKDTLQEALGDEKWKTLGFRLVRDCQ